MPDAALAPLLAKLFLLIRIISDYPEPAEAPTIHRLPQAELAAHACARPCILRAYYSRGGAIYIDETLDLAGDKYARSVLVHELVHYLQDLNGTHADQEACIRGPLLEREAYWVQDQYLRKVRGPMLSGLHYTNRFWRPCEDP
ncbi:MAG: hypothetical protein QF926_01905 [Alphaproteobacteria bacterium]|nr:hypothetical protein [Alphaproteobacteria bacterium]